MASSLSSAEDAQNAANPSRILIDTSVILDWLLDRHPFVDKALRFWEAHDAGRAILHIPASVLTDIFYIARRQVGADAAMECLDRSLAVFEVIPVNRAILLRARALPGHDFKDNVAIACGGRTTRHDYHSRRQGISALVRFSSRSNVPSIISG